MKNSILSFIPRAGVLAAALLLAFACTKSGAEPGIDDQMRFEPALPQTKASDSAFEEGDSFGVFAVEYEGSIPAPLQLSGNWANNSSSTFDGTKWTVTPPIYWKDEAKFDVFAYYPYCSEPNSVDDLLFNVLADQRQEGFTRSDLMWAKAKGVSRSDGAVKLNFRHKLSRLDINLVKGDDYEGELPQTAEVRIMNTVTSALLSLETGDIEKNPAGVSGTILAHQWETGRYSAILVPQKILNQVPMVEIVVNGVSYLLSTKFVFEEGVRHTMNITLSSNPEKVIINIGGGIEGWN